ncbi:MAG: hypothetical protein ACFB10_21190 [Salibacteraceae bacterium]
MRYFLMCLFLLFAPQCLQAQDPDSLATIQPGNKLHVFPDGSLWSINRLSHCYRSAPGSGVFYKYTGFDSLLGLSLYTDHLPYSVYVRFPKPNTVLLHGNLQLKNSPQKTAAFLRSTNSGQSWEAGQFPKGCQKKNLGHDAEGTLWLLTKNDRLYCSKDLGNSWNRIRLRQRQTPETNGKSIAFNCPIAVQVRPIAWR